MGAYVGGIDPNRDRMLISPYITSEELNHRDGRIQSFEARR
jgi:hypothetical protein